MKQICIDNVEYVDGLMLSLLFSDESSQMIDCSVLFEKHPHTQYNKYKKKSALKKNLVVQWQPHLGQAC
jgi:hypothetical protein